MLGITIGVAVSAALSRVLAQFLFGFSATDAGAFVLGGGIVLLGVVLASGIPARYAARVDPVVALKSE